MSRTPRILALLVSSFLWWGVNSAYAAETLHFYSSLTTEGQKKLVEGLEEAFPGLKVEWVRAGGVGIYQRYVTERLAGRSNVDILHTSYTPAWYHFASEGWVMPGIAEGGEADAFPDWAKDEKASFVALRVSTLQVVYNTNKVKKEEIPKSWKEFLTPKWRGRIAMVNPFESAGVWDFFYASPDFGEKYIRDLMANDPLIVRAMGPAGETISRGERDVTFIFEYQGLQRMKKGEPVAIALMQEGVPAIPAPVGAFKDAPNTEMAKKALNWILSKKGQSIVAGEIMTYSARPDVPPPPGLPPLSEVKLLHADFEKVYKEQDRYRALMERLLRRR